MKLPVKRPRHDVMTKAKAVVDYLYFTKSLRRVSKRYGVSKSAVHRWIKEDGRAKPIRTKKQISECVRSCMTRLFIQNPFITMREVSKELFKECGLKISARTANRYTKQTEFTLKKAVSIVDHKHDNAQVKSFAEAFLEANSDDSLYCLDEAGFYVGDHPRRGRAPKGQKLAVYAEKTMRKFKFSLMMIVGVHGVVDYEILTSNCKKVHLMAFFSRQKLPHGSTILMDNLRAHHSKEISAIVKSHNCKCLFTPPYSPRTNPIEKVFGMLKPAYRAACPLVSTSCRDDFHDTFEAIISIMDQSLRSTYENTAKFLRETIQQIDADPQFVFVGYDKVINPIRLRTNS